MSTPPDTTMIDTSGSSCTAGEHTLGMGVRALRLANEVMAVTLLPDKGADIYELVYRPLGLDVLWKTPWGTQKPGDTSLPAPQSSATAFLDAYPGGWQVLFPNGGDACQYRGVELGFHGEAAMAPWSYEIVETGGTVAEVRLATRLRRSPFHIQRSLRLESGRPVLVLHERITNEGGEPMDYMWSHHPAFGAPFLDAGCRIDLPATRLRADDLFDGPANPLKPAELYTWPLAPGGQTPLDLSRTPGPADQRALLAYLEDFADGWYAITNPQLGFGVGLIWPVDVFPYAWLWQEMHGSVGYPWYKSVYVMAIEPASSIPGQGLQAVMTKTQTHRTLEPGQSVELEMRAVFFESRTGVQHIAPDGRVTLLER